jgi:hypothetical protein
MQILCKQSGQQFGASTPVIFQREQNYVSRDANLVSQESTVETTQRTTPQVPPPIFQDQVPAEPLLAQQSPAQAPAPAAAPMLAACTLTFEAPNVAKNAIHSILCRKF